MKILSWNVNGLKSLIDDGFKDKIKKIEADIVCLQETKINKETDEFELERIL